MNKEQEKNKDVASVDNEKSGKRIPLKKAKSSSNQINFSSENKFLNEEVSKITNSMGIHSFINYCSFVPTRNLNASILTESKKYIVINNIKKFKPFESLNPFKRRVTTVAWHPVYANIIVVGSKGGEMILKNFSNTDCYFLPGIGPGGSIVGLKCCAENPYFAYTASITGKLRKEDFCGKTSQNLLSTHSFENWFSSLDVCYKRKLLLSGDCSGLCYLLSTSGEKIWISKTKMHKSKVTHCEFNSRDNLFITSSIDSSVKLWDLRMMEDSSSQPKYLKEFLHQRGVNSAYFSPSNGLSLLTTDQHSEIKIFRSPCWTESLTIKHPHRQFQHLTPIQATWHPLEDIIVVGRYPDENIFKNDERTIDFYDSTTGELKYKVESPSKKIISLNVFNISGDTLASAGGTNVTFFKASEDFGGAVIKHDVENDSDSENVTINIPKQRKKNLTTNTKQAKASKYFKNKKN